MQGYQPALKGEWEGQQLTRSTPRNITSLGCWPHHYLPPLLSYTQAEGEKGRWDRTAVLVAPSSQASLVGKPCLLLPPPPPPPSSETPPPSLTISNYTWSRVPAISSWPGWKVTWQKKGGGTQRRLVFFFLNANSLHNCRFEKWSSSGWFPMPGKAPCGNSLDSQEAPNQHRPVATPLLLPLSVSSCVPLQLAVQQRGGPAAGNVHLKIHPISDRLCSTLSLTYSRSPYGWTKSR